MPKIVTLEDFQKTKEQHKHHWEWEPGKMPEKKYVPPSRSYYRLTCGICKSKHWVLFSNIKKGHSMCCKKCTRLPTIEKMQELIKKYDMLWIPSLIHKPGSKSRYYWMKCKGCNKHHWVRWQRFSQGRVTACRSCAKRHSHGSIQDPTKYYKHPIGAAWRRVRLDLDLAYKDLNINISEWKDFNGFKEWCLRNGFVASAEPTLKRKDKSKPYSPENCYWENSKTIRNTIHMRGY